MMNTNSARATSTGGVESGTLEQSSIALAVWMIALMVAVIGLEIAPRQSISKLMLAAICASVVFIVMHGYKMFARLLNRTA